METSCCETKDEGEESSCFYTSTFPYSTEKHLLCKHIDATSQGLESPCNNGDDYLDIGMLRASGDPQFP